MRDTFVKKQFKSSGMETIKQSKLKWNTWQMINWKEVESQVFKLQKRIYRASMQANMPQLRKLQKTIVHSFYAKLLAVRKVTQENKGKKYRRSRWNKIT